MPKINKFRAWEQYLEKEEIRLTNAADRWSAKKPGDYGFEDKGNMLDYWNNGMRDLDRKWAALRNVVRETAQGNRL